MKKALIALVLTAGLLSGCSLLVVNGPPPATPANLALQPEDVDWTTSDGLPWVDGIIGTAIAMLGLDMYHEAQEFGDEEGEEEALIVGGVGFAYALSAMIDFDKVGDCNDFRQRLRDRNTSARSRPRTPARLPLPWPAPLEDGDDRLQRHSTHRLAQPAEGEKAQVKTSLMGTTGYSRAQLTRLIRQHRETGRIVDGRRK